LWFCIHAFGVTLPFPRLILDNLVGTVCYDDLFVVDQLARERLIFFYSYFRYFLFVIYTPEMISSLLQWPYRTPLVFG
jgi:hypothetical protein